MTDTKVGGDTDLGAAMRGWGRRPGAGRAARAALGAALLLPALAACGSDPPDGTPPSTSPPTPTSTSDSADPRPSADTTPADGPAVDTPALSLRLPAGYVADEDFAPLLYSGETPDRTERIIVGTVAAVGRRPLAALMDISAQAGGWDRRPRRLPPVLIDGEQCYHLRGTDQGRPRDEYGAVRGEDLIELTFILRRPPAQRQRIQESVLATVTWSG